MNIGIDNAIYYLEHHNKNLTKAQEDTIESIREYREGKYGFKDLAQIVINNDDLGVAISYLEHRGTEVYSKETLITFINAMFGAMEETLMSSPCRYENAKEWFRSDLIRQLEMLKVDFDGKEGR